VRVHHVALIVADADVEACARFYRDVLGLRSLDAPRDGVAWLDLDGAILMIEPAGGGVARAADRGTFVLALAIDAGERASWETRLRSRGIAIEQQTAYSMYVRDPSGNRVALSHYPVAS